MSSTHDAVAVGETAPPVVSFADQLRQLADLLDRHPELDRFQTYQFNKFGSVEEIVRLRREIGGRWDKRALGGYVELELEVGPRVSVALNVLREEACERVQVGEREIEVPDPEAPKVTITEPVYEWQCSPLLEGVSS